jgi:hypothetical protein
MDIAQLGRILEELEPGMALLVPLDWTTTAVEGSDEAERDLRTLELAQQNGCTWERDPTTKCLTFSKQPA